MNSNQLKTGTPYRFVISRHADSAGVVIKEHSIRRVYAWLDEDYNGFPAYVVKGQYPRQGFGSQQADVGTPIHEVIPVSSVLCIEEV